LRETGTSSRLEKTQRAPLSQRTVAIHEEEIDPNVSISATGRQKNPLSTDWTSGLHLRTGKFVPRSL
jgi:hypothetical protein